MKRFKDLVTKVIYMATIRWQKGKLTKQNYPKQVLQTFKSSCVLTSENSWKFFVFRYFENCLISSFFLQLKTDVLADIADLCHLQNWNDYVQIPGLIASENTLILLKLKLMQTWISAFRSLKRLLSVSCLVICHKGNCCSVRGWVFANKITTSINFKLRGFH